MQIRKVSASEAATWRAQGRGPARRLARTAWPDKTELQALLAELGDRRGITRIDIAGAAGGEHGWRGRLYARGIELHQQFSDARYGGPRGALLAAVAWRDSMRGIVGGRRERPEQPPRIARAEYARMCGWIAYKARKRKRYFADGAWGGCEAARAAAEAWLAGQV